MKPIRKCFISYLEEFARDEDDKLFLFDEVNNYSVDDIYRLTCGLATYFTKNGMKSSDNVAIRCDRSIAAVLVFFAVQSVGSLAVMCDPHEAPLDYVKESGVDIKIDHVIDYVGGWTLDGKPFKVTDAEKVDDFDYCKDVDKPALLIFTSGSTGKQKGVTLSQYNYVNHQRNFYVVGSYKFGGGDKAIQMLPMYHVFGIAQVVDSVLHRCPQFFPKEVTPDYICQCIEKYGFTRFAFVPSFALMLAQAKKEKGYDTSTLITAVLAGAPSTREQFEFIESQLGLKIVPVYGLSECIGISGAAGFEDAVDRASSVGKCLPMNEMRTDTPSGTAEGEIIVKGPAVMLGYYGEPEATKAVFDEKGYLHTGDLGYVDEKGFLHVTGRIKDIIIRNGNNISAAAIEQKLASLPFVLQAAVVGVNDEACGEIPVALITLKAGAAYDAGAVAGVLKKIEMPKEIRIVDEIPLTSSGKTDKQKIKELFSA